MSCATVGLAALAIVLGWMAAVAAEPLGAMRERLGVQADASRIAVSGISSGGYMAGQYHLAHSRKVIGAGIIAGGPYACALGSNAGCTALAWWMPRRLCRALHVCTALGRETFGAWSPYLGPPGHQHAVETAAREAAAGRIDPLEGLQGDRIWLFSGAADSLVPRGVMDDLEAAYTTLLARAASSGTPGRLVYETGIPVAHAMVVDDPGVDDCLATGPPYLNDCSYDAAGRLLAFIHDLAAEPAPARGAWDPEALLAFDQRPFFASGEPRLSLDAQGHVYLPARSTSPSTAAARRRR